MSVPVPKIELAASKVRHYKKFLLAQITEGNVPDEELFTFFAKVKKEYAENLEMLKAVAIIEDHKKFSIKRQILITVKPFKVNGKLSSESERLLMEYVQNFKEKNKNCPLPIVDCNDGRYINRRKTIESKNFHPVIICGRSSLKNGYFICR